MNIKNRIEKVRQKIKEKEVESIFISNPENRYYLSSFDGSAGYLLITLRKTILATDFRYMVQASIQASGYEILKVTGNMSEWFPSLVGDLGLHNMAFESADITFSTYEQLAGIAKKSLPQLKLIPLTGTVELLRMVKEPEEVSMITEAIHVTDSAFELAKKILNDGITELELAWEIEKYVREQGSQSVPFEVIVASGINAALPHAKPSSHRIIGGETVVIDAGAKLHNYTSDLTRTLVIDNLDREFQKIYSVVLEAQLEAISSLRAGMTGHEADATARTVIEKAGYGEAFGHGLGHGIGLAAHEGPRLGPNSADVLTEGMVFTVEPGIYLPGRGGVRIEDDVIIEDGKLRVISKASK